MSFGSRRLRLRLVSVLAVSFALLAPAQSFAASFYTLTPCRLLDTRNAAGPSGGPSLAAGLPRIETFAGRCGIPTSAEALAINATVVAGSQSGAINLYAGDIGAPATSVLNFSAGQVRANNAVVALGSAGDVAMLASLAAGATADLIVDVNGYWSGLPAGRVEPVAMTPPPASYTAAPSVTLFTSTAGASIYYTTDGTTPSPTHGRSSSH